MPRVPYSLNKFSPDQVNKYIRSGKEIDPATLSQETGLDANLFHLYKLIIERRVAHGWSYRL